MLALILTGLASFAAGLGCMWLYRCINDFLTQGRAAYMAFINAMEDPE